jgi:hypothetical protein
MKIKHRTVGWLVTRIAATVALLFGLNFIALMAVAITLVLTGHGEEPSPDWYTSWAVFGMVLPLAAFAAVGAGCGVGRLIGYWRDQ